MVSFIVFLKNIVSQVWYSDFLRVFKGKQGFIHRDSSIAVTCRCRFKTHWQFNPLLEAVASAFLKIQSKIRRLQHLTAELRDFWPQNYPLQTNPSLITLMYTFFQRFDYYISFFFFVMKEISIFATISLETFDEKTIVERKHRRFPNTVPLCRVSERKQNTMNRDGWL